jgi:hypothetical protein
MPQRLREWKPTPFVSATLTANTAMPVRTLAVALLNNDNTDSPNRKDLRPTFQPVIS